MRVDFRKKFTANSPPNIKTALATTQVFTQSNVGGKKGCKFLPMPENGSGGVPASPTLLLKCLPALFLVHRGKLESDYRGQKRGKGTDLEIGKR